jgi:hypothetical protein
LPKANSILSANGGQPWLQRHPWRCPAGAIGILPDFRFGILAKGKLHPVRCWRFNMLFFFKLPIYYLRGVSKTFGLGKFPVTSTLNFCLTIEAVSKSGFQGVFRH